MISIKYIKFIPLITLVYNCSSSQINEQPKDIQLKDELTLFSRTKLRIRDNYAIDSNIIKVIPINTKVNCFRETTLTFKIDDLNSKWYKCKTKGIEGWIYGGYLSLYRSIELNKNNRFYIADNDSAEISLDLYKNGSFMLTFRNSIDNEWNSGVWYGDWSYSGNELKLKFTTTNGGEKYLFYVDDNTKVTKDVTYLGNSTYKINSTDGSIRIWGVLCYIVEITP
ncbi:SH3 domain-containing protein [Leptospira jelokensis]|uniref:SH3 domain-containing protein n=1 Tax=Leptospira jelokensis TaxID=2484931 RepID=UPI00110103DE|nr:SH3 domain-containing protein [Leptospira jelokensis]TGL97885.1 SH3 domain-containing protein [Leptospira jelokensis]